MTTANNYGHQALSAIEAYITSLEQENTRLRQELNWFHRIGLYEGAQSHEDARGDLAAPLAAHCYPGEQS